MARLLFRDSQGREGAVELSPTETVYVGRGLECAIRTDDGMVSRRHSQIRMEAGRFVVEDLGSANGTILNNTRVQKQALGHADVVQCGSLVIRFIDETSVGVVRQQGVQPSGVAPPPKKGGTMVLDRNEQAPLPGGAPVPGSVPPQGFQPVPPGSQPGYNPAAVPGSQPPHVGSQTGGAFRGGASGGLGFEGTQLNMNPGGAPVPGAPQVSPRHASIPPGGGLPYGGPPGVPGGPAQGGSMFGANRGFGGAAQPIAGSAPPIAGAPTPYGGPPAMPGGGPPAMPGGGPPGMPGGAPNLPYGGPPGMPGGAPSSGVPQAYGGPPAMPGGGPPAMPASGPPAMPSAGSPPSMFGRNGPANATTGAAAPRDPESKVMVELGLEYDASKASEEIKKLKEELSKQTSAYEREVADGKRVRAEAATLRERTDELRAQIKDREEQVTAHDRVADELRDELQQTRNELSRMRNEMGELAENMAARERQAARAVEDTAKIREDMEDLQRQLMEVSRTKDEGWKKLNDQLTEIDHLRDVINEQERMLEERRVGLITQEEVIKELRSDKEKNLKIIAQLKAERDEASGSMTRSNAQITAIEEENRRLGRLLVEAQSGPERGGAQPDHMMRLTGDVTHLRVELKKVEADRDRLAEQYEKAEQDREKLEGRLAKVEVELQETQHAKMSAESARNVAQDALAKAEVARHKAAEEALNAAKARDSASTGGDDARREVEKLKRRVAELEKAGGATTPAIDPKELQLEREAGERKLREATENAAAAERSLKALQAEVDAAKTDAQKARAEAARARAAADAQAESVIEAAGSTAGATSQAGAAEIAGKAQEVYEAINDILSEMRNNMVLVKGELPNLSAEDTTLRAVTEAVEALVDSAETAKGALRGLREIADSK